MAPVKASKGSIKAYFKTAKKLDKCVRGFHPSEVHQRFGISQHSSNEEKEELRKLLAELCIFRDYGKFKVWTLKNYES